MKLLPKVRYLGDTIGHYLIQIRCMSCDHKVILDPATIAIRTGYGIEWEQLMTRFKCSKCGARAAMLSTISSAKP